MAASNSQTLAALRRKLAAAGEHPPAQAMRDYLQQVRELRVRETELVVRYGTELLDRHARSLEPDELWELHEQVALAAMEAGCKDLALRLVKNVHSRFPSGSRGSRLTGTYFELLGSYADAEALYKKELESDPMNAMMLKRMAALRRGQGDLPGAAELLKAYLAGQGATDWLAWEEAADVYLSIQMYQQAAFCLEELLLHQPADQARHLLYADTLYTLGSAANWRTARRHYSGVIEMTRGASMRALYGVCACAAQLAGVRRGGGGDGDGGELARAAAEALQRQYAVHCPSKLPLVRGMLAAQGLL